MAQPADTGVKASGGSLKLARRTRSSGKKETAAPATVPGGGGATLVATFGDWSAYTAQTGKSKICYALSQPKSRAPGSIKDTPAYVFVSFRPAENVKDEIASVLNFETKDGGPAQIAIGKTDYAMVTKGQNAWIKTPTEEPQAISTMTKGSTMSLSATSKRGNKTTDKYSLSGFGQALERARKECS